MKKAFLFTGFLFFALYSLSAQIRPKQEDWFSYDLTHDILLNAPAGTELSWRSNGHSLTFTDDLLLGSSNLSFAYGLGFTSNNYFQNIRISTDESSGDEVFEFVGTDSIRSNKFSNQYLHIPLELRFRSDPDEKGRFFRWYIGTKWGVRINSYSRYKTEEVNIQYNKLDDLNLFTGGIYTRIGYGYFSLYAYYGLLPLFEQGQVLREGVADPAYSNELRDIRTLSLGISLSL